MMPKMTLDLTPRLVAHLVRIEKLVGAKSNAELVCEALRFYEDILNRALEGKIRLSLPAEAEDRRELASRVGLLPKA